MASVVTVGAVIVAAGQSRRMEGQDKLQALIHGRSVLQWAVQAVANAASISEVVVVAAPPQVPELQDAPWLRAVGAHVVAGGRSRQESVVAGVRAIGTDIVLVHDAARPLVSARLIDDVAEASAIHGAAVPVLPVVDALRVVREGRVTGVAAREGLHRTQTPQGARRELLLAAFDAIPARRAPVSDEAELLSGYGATVMTVPGDPANIKITMPEDLALVRRLAGADGVRSASGWDSHPFGPGDGLRLGGLEIPDAPQLHGHSDGDVVLHALCDGLLAACGLGDLGRLFPDSDRRTLGVDSRQMLAAVLERVEGAGYRPTAADVTIVGSRPRLGADRLDAMRDAISAGLGLGPGLVSVKASSGNLSGPDGAGRSISASCLVTVAVP